MDAKRQAWVEARRHSLGGSDAAAIIGLNRFSTPFTVWADKMGALPPQEENERMRLGTYLEPYVADRFAEITGKRVQRVNTLLKNPAYPFAHANIDRRIIGEKAGLECKTTSVLNTKRFRNGEYPGEYYAQCVHYMAVTGWDKWYLAALVLGSPDEPMIYEIERDEDEIRALMEAEATFWARYITGGEEPPLDGLKPTGEALGALYADTADTAIAIYKDSAVENFLRLTEQSKEIEKTVEQFKQELQLALGEHELGVCGKYDVIWRRESRRTFDHKRFAADNPTIDLSNYFNTSAYRKFRIKEARPE